MEMHQLQIPMAGDDESWKERCYDRMERLKAREFQGSENPPSHQPTLSMQEELFGEKNSEILELQKAVQKENVDSFLDMLEQLCSEKKLPLSTMFDQVTPAGDSLLHVAAYFGKAEIAELIGHHFPELLTKTNIKGDTPLHVAARERSTGVINLILSQYAAYKSISLREKNRDEGITRMINEYGNMAMHEAVGSKHDEGVKLLFEEDKCVAHYLNKSNKSPLYLAVLSSSKGLVNILLEAPFPNNKSLPKCHGNSPLHAAIYTKNADLVEEIVEKRPDLMFIRDEYEGTPLHYAAATGYAKGIDLLGKKSTLTALEWNSKGQLPIHLACKFGHIEVLKEFFQQKWLDPKVLLNKKGQNILDVAAKNGRENVVQHLLKNTKFKHSINEKDKNGNTPLHLAAKNFHRSILFSLTEEKNIDANLMNNEDLTARDIVLLKNTLMTNRQMLSNAILVSAGAQTSGKAKSKFSKSEDRIRAKEEGLTNKINTMMVVATLIATVTFAAGITVPGGLYSSDYRLPRQRGMPLFLNRGMFRHFVVYDVVAMCSSTIGASMLLAAQLVGDVDLGLTLLMIATLWVTLALEFMMVAFASAVYLVVSDVFWLQRFDDLFMTASLILLFGVLPLYTGCRVVAGRFTLSVHRVLFVLSAFVALRRKDHKFGYLPNY